jgi:uncharacterized protein YoxC
MNTFIFPFVCGILTILAVAFVAVIIAGIVQTYKNKRTITDIINGNDYMDKQHDDNLQKLTQDVSNSIEELNDNLNQREDLINQYIKDETKNIYDYISKLKSEFDSKIDKAKVSMSKETTDILNKK